LTEINIFKIRIAALKGISGESRTLSPRLRKQLEFEIQRKIGVKIGLRFGAASRGVVKNVLDIGNNLHIFAQRPAESGQQYVGFGIVGHGNVIDLAAVGVGIEQTVEAADKFHFLAQFEYAENRHELHVAADTRLLGVADPEIEAASSPFALHAGESLKNIDRTIVACVGVIGVQFKEQRLGGLKIEAAVNRLAVVGF